MRLTIPANRHKIRRASARKRRRRQRNIHQEHQRVRKAPSSSAWRRHGPVKYVVVISLMTTSTEAAAAKSFCNWRLRPHTRTAIELRLTTHSFILHEFHPPSCFSSSLTRLLFFHRSHFAIASNSDKRAHTAECRQETREDYCVNNPLGRSQNALTSGENFMHGGEKRGNVREVLSNVCLYIFIHQSGSRRRVVSLRRLPPLSLYTHSECVQNANTQQRRHDRARRWRRKRVINIWVRDFSLFNMTDGEFVMRCDECTYAT